MNLTTIVFDLGGVCVGSPVSAIRDYERHLGLPPRFIGVSVATAGDMGPFQRFERGELTYAAFLPLFQAHLTSPTRLVTYQRWRTSRRMRHEHQRHSSASSADDHDGVDWDAVRGVVAKIDARDLFERMVRRSMRVEREMVWAIEKLKESGKFKLGCITNDFALPPSASSSPSADLAHLMSLFDVVVSSSTEGIRKPDPRIFKIACQRLRVTDPRQVLFLDDLKENIEGAQRLGMRTIWVKDVRKAVGELGNVVGMDLVSRQSDSEDLKRQKLRAKL
ncbi:HAD-like domain-containing protein [Catenaria anguillulae PL171]|uniref:HAD-like domain-containing protein n=1 Tax=Catenaria anguillulae PL171 TaxID=765915 RepID=A0A1Y2I3G6_9FUNG|nr:HAD-like domain-containing protein [Catenaria anguillulae PL171]